MPRALCVIHSSIDGDVLPHVYCRAQGTARSNEAQVRKLKLIMEQEVSQGGGRQEQKYFRS
jgi:hypothetical protein